MTGHKHDVGHKHQGVFRALINMHENYVIVESCRLNQLQRMYSMARSLFLNAFIVV